MEQLKVNIPSHAFTGSGQVTKTGAGNWVVYEGKTGITSNVNLSAGTTEVHLVSQETGETTTIIPDVPFSALTKAERDQIPPCRIQGISDEVLTRLGY